MKNIIVAQKYLPNIGMKLGSILFNDSLDKISAS